MNESAARAERVNAPASPASYYVWEVAQKPVGVRINLELVDRLEHDVVESFRSLNSRGSEIGGLLVGTVQNGNPARVLIESYELISCDYTRGPLYRLGEADAERFATAIKQRNGANGQRVVGFFRSHTRKGLGLDAEDLAFFTAHFHDPQQVALLIRPYASKASTAGLFIWENDSVHGDASYQEFPFRRSELQSNARPEPARAPEPAASAPQPAAAPTETPAVKPAPRAQIVPIASRREISVPPPPQQEPEAKTKTETPAQAEAPARPADKQEKQEKSEKQEKPDRAEKLDSRVQEEVREPRERPEARQKPEMREKPDTREKLEKPAESAATAEIVVPPLQKLGGGKMIWIAGAAAVIVLLLSAALMYPRMNKPRRAAAIPGQDTSALALRVERSSGELLLSWNRDSEVIKSAAKAVLAISDGDQHENVTLDLGQLRNGSIVYSPSSSDVVFQLSVTGQNSSQVQSESLRVLRTRPSPMPENPTASQEKLAAATRVNNTAPVSNSPLLATPVAPPEVTPAPAVEEPKPVPAAPQVKPFRADSLSTRLRPALPSDLPEAPGLSTTSPAAVPLPGVNLLSLPQPVPVPGSASQAGSSGATKQGSQIKQGGQIQQAELIYHKNPEYPLVARQAHVQGVVVVSAMIGTDGKVKSANAVSGPALLQKAAVEAVKQWIYKPTTLNGAPVEGETRVEIRFTNDRQ